jgi:hypothetical protein
MSKQKHRKRRSSVGSGPDDYYAQMDGQTNQRREPKNPNVYAPKSAKTAECSLPGDEGEGRVFPEEDEFY